jgi:hypothetical protein
MIVGVVEALQLCPLRSALATAQEAQLVVFASALITIGLADLLGHTRGWYLMEPPLLQNPWWLQYWPWTTARGWNLDAPLSRWITRSEFETLKECHNEAGRSGAWSRRYRRALGALPVFAARQWEFRLSSIDAWAVGDQRNAGGDHREHRHGDHLGGDASSALALE